MGRIGLMIALLFCLGCSESEKTETANGSPAGEQKAVQELPASSYEKKKRSDAIDAFEAMEKSGVFEHPNTKRRANALDLLGSLIEDAPIEVQAEMTKTLARLANDSETALRVRAINTLQELGEQSRVVAETAVPALVALLSHEDPSTRASALEALGDIGDAQAYRKADLSGDENPVTNEALSKIVQRLEDSDEGVREDAPRVLAKLTEYNLPAAKQVLPAVQKQLSHKEPGVRAAAAESIAHMAERLGRVRRGLLKTSTEEYQTKAAEIAELLNPALPAIEALQKDEAAEVRGEAERAAKAVKEATE